MSNHSHSIFGERELHFVFFRRPVEFLPSDDSSGHVSGIRFEKTHLKGNGDSGKQLAVGTGQYEDINCGVVLKSIGYKSVPVEELPFDDRRGIVPNKEGRVFSDNSEDSIPENGLYVVGWLKRGPTGIVATNLYCAEETVRSISSDITKGKIVEPSSKKSGRKGLIEILDKKKVESVSFEGWEKIDSKEKMLGCLKNKPRAKITTWDELLKTSKLEVSN
ncbi:hypothetical protein ZOSMA_8G00580 [Zostera marina]|uniref:NADPH:adrenodoxin oxidoreductase, mitochondrial n=1 Tax=Zostera marina TaxID=29655 RepID=A0A0K9NJG6_ZOSMR|nr:hypothetical protein ZOSMA_8G00580 [Zostera marina]